MSVKFINVRIGCLLVVFGWCIVMVIFSEELQKIMKERSLSSELNNLWDTFIIGDHKQSLKQIDNILSNRGLFQTYNLLLQANENLETSVECIGPLYNQSCLYKNLYYADKSFWMFTTKKTALPLPEVRVGAFIMTQFSPNWRPFYSYVALDKFVRDEINPIVIPNVTVYFEQPWLFNIGHALFDGLYPAYMSLSRFPPKHLQPFRILLSTGNNNGKPSFSEDVYNLFAGLGTINASFLEEISVGRWFAFQELVMGSGNLCQRCLQPNLQLPGGLELNGSRLFRERMYKQHGLAPPASKNNHSAERRNLQRPLRAYIIDNKRFTLQDKMEINAAIDEINKYIDADRNQTAQNQTKLQWPLVHVSYIDYLLITGEGNGSLRFNTAQMESRTLANNRMRTHLRLLQDIDIYVTGPGTGQMYQTFLSDGSTIINLGALGYIKKQNTIIKNYTSYMEQYMTAGTPYIKGLYYPINQRSKGIKRDTVITLIREAARLIIEGFSIPVNPKDNLAPDGQLFTEMCELDKNFCTTVTERSEKSNFLCIDTWPEDIVHENGPWAIEGVIDGDQNVTCSYNRTLLLHLRKKYNIHF